MLTVERADDEKEKSVAEQEQNLLDKQEEKNQPTDLKTEDKIEEPIIDKVPEVQAEIEIDDEKVLSHIRTKHGKEVNSIEELFQTKESDDLPEELKAYKKYRNETGRSYDDFRALNRDFDKEDPTKLVREFTKASNPELEDADVDFLMSKFQAEEFEDEKDVRSKEIEFRKELKKAKDFFNGQKEQYKVPLESNDTFVPEKDRESYRSFQQYQKTLDEARAEDRRKSEVFTEKTNSLFSDTFEGFEVSLGEQTMKYKPAEASVLKEQQSNLMNFVGKFLNEDGTLKDEKAFHRAIAVGNDIEKFGKWAFEAGMAAEAEKQSRDAKNIDMNKKPQQAVPKSGLTFQVEDDDNVSELKMKRKQN